MENGNGGSGSGSVGRSLDGSSNIQDADSLVNFYKSVELRKGFEDLMEHIQRHRREESSESFEERYLLLISSYPPQCLKIAVTLTDADVLEHSSSASSSQPTLRLPIHLACDKAAPLSIVKSLLDADADKKGDHPSIRRADKWGDLPIHIACSRASAALSKADRELYGMQGTPLAESDGTDTTRTIIANETVEAIRLLLEADRDKSTLSIKDVYESLPLHTAARYNAPPEVIALLLEAGHGLYTEGLHGQFPLTVACRSGSPRPEVLKLLLEHDDTGANSGKHGGDKEPRPPTILHTDATGRLPIHVFMLRNTCEACLRILLEALFGRSRTNHRSRSSILSIGLDEWKRTWLSRTIPAMDGTNTYERDFTTRDKLDVICSEARAFCEICGSLELVVWKMSCLSGIREEGGDPNLAATTMEKRDAKWKQHRRIVSGTEIIAPNVLAFLEDEPVKRILDRFRSYGYLAKIN